MTQTPAQEFTLHDGNRTELRRLLDTPILKRALAILRDEVKAKTESPAVANPVVAAARFHQIAGVNHILDGLERLTQTYNPPTTLRGKSLLKEVPLEETL